MSCEEFIRTLEDEGAPTPAAAEHARGCAACRRELERWSAVRAELQAMRSEDPPPFLHTRVMAHVESVRSSGSGRGVLLSWLRPAVAGPLIVLALAAGLGALQVWRRASAPAPNETRGLVAETRPLEDAGPDNERPAPVAAAPEGVAAPPNATRVAARAGETRAKGRRTEAQSPPPGAAASAEADRALVPPPPVAGAIDVGHGAPPADEIAAAAPSRDAAFEEISVEKVAAAPAGARLAARASPRGPAPTCRVESEDGTVFGVVGLPALECPPGPLFRLITVAEDGAMARLDPATRAAEPLSPSSRAALRELRLAPGRYRLLPVAP